MERMRVGAADPARLIWYGWCTYWTDDWSKLNTSGIPACPTCGAYGYQDDAASWMESAAKYETDGHPRYQEFLQFAKETCRGKYEFMKWYAEWLAEQQGRGHSR